MSSEPPANAPDIVQLAQAQGLSAVYVPSMRNGTGQDRGNAILSTEALSAPLAIELPFGLQRRVAVGATIGDPWDAASAGIRVISTHLDLSRGRVAQAEALAAWGASLTGATILGGDLNSVEGQNDGTYKALAGRLSAESCGDRRTHAWPWRLELFFGGWVGRLDHVFTNLPDDRWTTRCSTIPHFFGSDHRPILFVLTRRSQPSRSTDLQQGVNERRQGARESRGHHQTGNHEQQQQQRQQPPLLLGPRHRK